MSVYSNSTSFVQFAVKGEIPTGPEQFNWLSESLAGRAFRSIEFTTDEASEGWTRTDEIDNSTFDTPTAFMRDHYLLFSYRRDQRKIIGAALKSYVARAEAEYLTKRPELKRPPKREREDIKERVKLQLLAKTFPTPSTVDVVWDCTTNILTLFSISTKIMERFEELFTKTFEGLKLQIIYPYARGLSVLGPSAEKLAALNQAGSDSALDQIHSNRWIGEDFLVWLLCNGLTGSDAYRVSTADSTGTDAICSAWVDDKIKFQGGGEGGPQKVAVSGSQDKYLEARSALTAGKVISSALVHLEKDELEWRFALNAELFTFSSFKCPPVKVERKGAEDLPERESAFYERIFLLKTGLQLFDSLYETFLSERTSERWAFWIQKYQAWLSEV